MADETKIIRIVIDSSAAVDGSRKATDALARMEKGMDQSRSALERMEAGLGRLPAMFAAAFAIDRMENMARAVIRAADAFTQFSNALKVSGLQGQALQTVQDRLFAAANKNGVELTALGQVYGRIAMSSKELGATQADMMKFVDGVTAALRVQGGSTEQASGALLQLSQAMGAGTVRAEEFNSILEGALPIAQAAARGMDGMGGSVAKLRAAVVEGKVSSEAFFNALLKGFDQTKVQAEQASLTIGGAMTALNNSFTKFVGNVDSSVSASRSLISIINTLSSALDRVGESAKTASGSVLALMQMAINPGGYVASMIMSKTPLETLDAQTEKLNKSIKEREAAMERFTQADWRHKQYTEQQLAKERAQLAELDRQRNVLQYGGKPKGIYQDDPDNIGIVVNRPPAAPPKPDSKGGSGESAAERYRQLEQQLMNTATAQKAMTAAAIDGEQAFDKAKATVEAQNKTLEIFKTQLDESDPRLTRLRDLLLEIERSKAAEAFALATTEIQKQNEVLEAEKRLIGASNEQRAVELALIKSRQDAEKAGVAVTAEMQQQRRAAVETNERLKAQGEELKKANELWTAPLKSALESIQRTGADMWEQLLENGKFSAEEFGQIFAKMARRAAAELLALATIRPVIQVALQGVGSLGLVTPATAASLGYPTSGSATGAIGGSYGGGLGGGMFGGSSGLFSPTFMQQPIFGGIDAEIANWSTYGTAAQNSLAPTTWGQAFGVGGGLLSMGMGAMNLFNARGNTGKTLGGIAGLLGGGLGIAGALMPTALGGMLGPIGMAVGLLGGLLPGLFGGGQETPPMPPLTYGQGTIWANGTGFDYSGGGMNGGNSMSAGAASIGQSLQSLFSRGGLSAVSGRLIGGDIASGVNNVWSNGGWQGQNYTQIGLHTPTGYERVTYNDTSRTAEQAADLLVAEMFKANVLRGGVSGVSDSLKTATQTANPTTAKAVQDLVDFVNIYEKIGKTSNATADALKAVDDKFASITESATKYGLSLAPIDKAKADEKLKIATDFATGIQRAIDDMSDPVKGQLADLDKQYQAAKDTNAELIKANIGAQDQILNIEKLYGDQRAKLVEQQQQAATQKVIDDAAKFFARDNALFVARQGFNKSMAALNQDMASMGQSPMARTIAGWSSEAGKIMTDTEATFGYGSPEYMQASAAAARQYSQRIKQASDDFIEGMRAMVKELDSPGASSMSQLMKQRAADIATATALDGPAFDGLWAIGANVKAAMDAWNKKIFKVADDFRYSISQGLLAFTDPLQAQINDLNKQRDEALATARENNAAVEKINNEYYGRAALLDNISVNNRWSVKEINEKAEKAGRALTDIEQSRVEALLKEADLAKSLADQVNAEAANLGYHYVSINDVTELFLKKEQQLREQYYAQALSGLEDLIKRITIGDLSGASSLTVLNGTQASYEAIRAQAFAGDQTARQNFSQTAGEYLAAGRDYYAYSPAYFAIRDQIKADIETLTTQIKGGTTGGSAVSPDVQAVTQQLERALADNDNLKRTVEQLLAKQDRTNDLLERLAANSLR